MSSNYTSFSIGQRDPRQVRFSPNSVSGQQMMAQPKPGFVSESCGCSDLLGDHDDLQCRMHNVEFCLIAGNAKTALYVQLWNVRCREDVMEDDPSTWLPLNIAGYKWITAYIRKMDDHDERFILHGYPVAPLSAGKVVFLFHPGVLDCVGGIYEGEVEIEYKDGKIVTAIEWFQLRIEEDFSGHGHRDTHPECDEPVDHHPGIPGIQQLPELPEEIPIPAQLPTLIPDMPEHLPEEISPELQVVMHRNSIRRYALGAGK